ncbi:alpha/beta hydrolase [Ensifer aridi]|uniref:alpha/beta hydrolase n=1 Tax=Ensifer aridi TaxID=1708715 RepID=UPI0009BD0246|nr:alpha/beta hydrolase [Ensifer aridi]
MERLEFRLLGFPEFRLSGRPVKLELRKAAALLIYLAEASRPVAREVAATLLWPEADEETARARLRRTLYKIRVAFGEEVIAASGTSLCLQPALSVEADTKVFEHACNFGRLDEAGDIYGGDFLAGLSLPDCPEFEEWAFFRREGLRSLLVQALERLTEAKIADCEPRAAIVHARRLVGLDPLSENAHRHLIRAYLLAGDRAAAERQYETCCKLLAEELGVPVNRETTELLEVTEKLATSVQTRYAARNGIHLAYQTVGEGALDVVFVPGFVSHVERAWDDPRGRAFLMKLAGLGRLVFFDRRGVGLSDRIGAPPTVEATAEDILTVLDAIGSRRALLIGASEGGPGCIRFAAGWPKRLAGLVLYGSLARGSRSEDYPFVLTPAQYDAWLARLVAQWGGPSEIETFAPGLADDRQARSWWAGLLRAASSPGAIRAVLAALRDTDVRSLLSSIRVPTLVLHRRGDRAVRFDAGRHLAEEIPSARFVELDGIDHWAWAGDQDAVIDRIRTFAAQL